MLSLLLIIFFLCGIVPCNFVSAVCYSDGYAGGKNGDANGILAKDTDFSS